MSAFHGGFRWGLQHKKEKALFYVDTFSGRWYLIVEEVFLNDYNCKIAERENNFC